MKTLTITKYNGFNLYSKESDGVIVCADGTPQQVQFQNYTKISKSVLKKLKKDMEKYLLFLFETKFLQKPAKQEKIKIRNEIENRILNIEVSY